MCEEWSSAKAILIVLTALNQIANTKKIKIKQAKFINIIVKANMYHAIVPCLQCMTPKFELKSVRNWKSRIAIWDGFYDLFGRMFVLQNIEYFYAGLI